MEMGWIEKHNSNGFFENTECVYQTVKDLCCPSGHCVQVRQWLQASKSVQEACERLVVISQSSGCFNANLSLQKRGFYCFQERGSGSLEIFGKSSNDQVEVNSLDDAFDSITRDSRWGTCKLQGTDFGCS